jgi:hypothetical protein
LKVFHMTGTKRSKTRSAKRVTPPARKQESSAAAAAGKTRTSAPLLATAPKKVGKVTDKEADGVKPTAPYQPKTDATPPAAAKPKAAARAPRAPSAPAFDPIAFTRPWLQLGFHMTMANLTLQARVAKAALDLPPAAIAMHQGTAAYKTWLAMMGGARPANG